MTARRWYAITNRAGEAEVFLYAPIGGPDGITAKDFIAKLKPHASKPIRLSTRRAAASSMPSAFSTR
jgi:hypothetical protein